MNMRGTRPPRLDLLVGEGVSVEQDVQVRGQLTHGDVVIHRYLIQRALLPRGIHRQRNGAKAQGVVHTATTTACTPRVNISRRRLRSPAFTRLANE